MQVDDIAKKFVKQAIKEGITDRRSLQKLKNRFSTEYGISSLTSVEILRAYGELVREEGARPQKGKKVHTFPGESMYKRDVRLSDLRLPDLEFEKLIRKRGVRSLSGIASVTVITKDYDCPGKCIYCPKEPDMPKSYLSNEPAVMRAILNDFDPYRQVAARLEGLGKTGHPTDKIEMIIAGGTFNFYPSEYQTDFVKGVFDGLNGRKSHTLEEAQCVNETAEHRCVGLSVETRPDYVTEEALTCFRELGCTKVEIGVQCLDDEIYELNKRGHGVAEVREAMRLLKDAGFKINAHFMPNMYGSDLKKDLKMFRELFDDPDFRPDWLKIYPCVVVPYSPLEKIYREGGHKPYSDKELIDLLVKFKELVPPWCRLTRLYRDIPAESIIGGSKLSNLRQYVQKEMGERGVVCRCIRCRELKGQDYNPDDVELRVIEYDSSGGKEYFVSFEDIKNDLIIGFLRLRVPLKSWVKELSGAAIIREIHVFGEHVKVGGKVKKAGQHKGYGRQLIEKAVELTKSEGLSKLSVISGVGVREYYRKLGFEDGGLYQFKGI